MSEVEYSPPQVAYVKEFERRTIPDSISVSPKFPRFTKLLNEMIPIMKNLNNFISKYSNDLNESTLACNRAILLNKLPEARTYLTDMAKNYNKLIKIIRDLITYKQEIYDIVFSISESVEDTVELVE
jgi:hypothetical protein